MHEAGSNKYLPCEQAGQWGVPGAALLYAKQQESCSTHHRGRCMLNGGQAEGKSLEDERAQEKTFISPYSSPPTNTLSPPRLKKLVHTSESLLCEEENQRPFAHVPGTKCRWNPVRAWRLGGKLSRAQMKSPRSSEDTMHRYLL